MNLRHIVSFFLLITSLHLSAQEQVNLSGTWNFALAKTSEEAQHLENFYTSNFVANDFKPIPVPSNWAVLGYEEPVYRGFKDNQASEGFYLYDFATPEGWNDIVDSYRNPTRDYLETKAVYAPVYTAIDKIPFVPGEDSVRIPIQNDFDFTNLSTVSIDWSIW